MSYKYSALLRAPLAFAAILSVTGCQLTQVEPEIVETQNQPNCDPMGFGHVTCEDVDAGVIPVIHPDEDVTVDLTPDEPIAVEITNVWDRVSQQLAFDIPDNQRLNAQRNWYLKHPSYMARVSKRASPFLYYIVDEIEKRDMPLELALLPIVESAFDPFAYSHGRAAGMWQFVPGTAKRFGMKQNWWYDGRRDVIASTQGALDYLEYLLKYFDGDWLHALAAYNSGEGRVRKAIKKNAKAGKPTDFWSLSLPKETRAYVPKLLALADILKKHDEYDFSWPEVENAPVITVVDTESQIDLAYAATLADMTLRELHALNPGYNKWATDPDGPHRLVLPITKAELFSTELAKVDRKDRLNWTRHKIKSGDSLLKLAKQYHTTVDIIKRVNDQANNMIRVGDYLMIPVALKQLDEYTLSDDQRLASTQSKKRGAYKINHTVKRGDTFWDLSREYNVGMRELAKWNGMAPTDPLIPGKSLVVWQKQASTNQSQDAIMRSLTYTVRRGDSIARIASKFNVRSSDITKWNNLNPKKYLQPGQKLKLYVDVTRTKNVG